MNQSKLVIVLLLLLILSGCSPMLPTPDNQPGVKETATQVSPLPTQTRIPASPTPPLTPTVSLQEAAMADFLHNSIDLISTPFENVTVDGFLILENSQSDNYFFYDMQNKKIADIGKNHEGITSCWVSPNKKFILAGACPTDKCDYFLRTINKIIKTNFPTQDDWVLARWLDNERVVFLPRIKPGDPVQPQNEVIYNVFTGEKSNLQLYLPNPKTIGNSGGPDNLFEASLDSSLKRVVFTNQNDRLVLWNLDTKKEMASLSYAAETVSSFGADGWSLDGKKFVTTSPYKFQVDAYGKDIWAANELFMFDMDGNLTQLTHYNEKLPFATVFRPQWSPDNRRIAFWLTIGDAAPKPKNLQQWLAVFDTSTLETKLYRSDSSTVSSSINWSPDGQQLIVSDWDRNLTLVDLAHNTKSLIPDTQDMMIWDWMAP